MRRIAVPALLLGGLAHPATAQTTTQAFPVSATITAGCIVATDANGRWGQIDFGTVSGAQQGSVDAALVSTGGAGIVVECTPGVSASLTADTGLHAASGARRMAAGAGGTPVPYLLFADGSATPWTTQGVPLAFVAGTGRRTVPILGRAQLNRPVAAGRYTDTVTVTIGW
jgi:spore coat protein U-like protein